MFSKHCLLYLTLFALPSFAQDGVLKVQPEQCVVVKEGRQCQANVTFTWQKNEPSDVCLYQADELTTPIACWQNETSGEQRYRFKGANSQLFVLKSPTSDRELLKVTVNVSWVYQKKESSSWRLF